MPAASNLALNSVVVDLLEDVLEAAVIGLEDGVLGREIDRVLAAAGRSSARRGRSRGSSRRGCTCAMATPAPGDLNTSFSITVPSSPTNLMVSVPLPGTLKSVARYWSPKAWRPTTIGWVQPGTRRGTFLQMIGSRKITPPRMLRIVPLGDFHISLRLNSFTRASSGVMVAHLTPTPYFLIALAASTVTWSSVASRFSIAEVVVLAGRCRDRGGSACP